MSAEERGRARPRPVTIPCPCGFGVVFQDARGGYECTACDTRFKIKRVPPQSYAGPGGDLTWFEQLRANVGLWLLPKEKALPPSATVDPATCPICNAGPDEDCDAGLHS